MRPQEIIFRRLANQGLIGAGFSSPQDAVRHFAAMQAQDFSGAKWAIGQRCDATDAQVSTLFQEGAILRTHLCRPTWHFVLAQDIRWILELTKHRVRQANAFMDRRLGLDAKLYHRATMIIARTLEGGKHLEREELMIALQRARIDTSEFRSAHFMMHAELEGVVCSGPRVGKQFTYALLEERAPKAAPLDRTEALAELTRRFFLSRGPASLYDLALWSGLTLAEAKKGIALVGKEFVRVTINGRDNWFRDPGAVVKVPASTVHLLPNYDEYGIGYKDRSAFHDPARTRLSGGRSDPVFRNLLVLNGRMMGTWDRTLRQKDVALSFAPLLPLSASAQRGVRKAAERYARFLELPLSKSA